MINNKVEKLKICDNQRYLRETKNKNRLKQVQNNKLESAIISVICGKNNNIR